MELQSPKIKFYLRRSFGEKLNATFDFIKQNWKPLLKYATYFVLPVCIIQAFFFNKAMGIVMTAVMSPAEIYSATSQPTHYLLSLLFNLIGGMLLVCPVYTLVQLYNSRADGLSNITIDDMKPYIFRSMGQYLLAMIVVAVVTILFAMMMAALLVNLYSFFLQYVLLLYIMMLVVYVPLSLIVPIIIFERISLWEAIKKTFRLGFATWAGIFGIWVVMGILYSVLAGVIMLPLIVVYAVNSLLSTDVTAQTDTSTWYSVGVYLLSILSLYGAYLFMILPVLGIGYQYAHANEKLNSISVVDEIDNFENF